MKIGVPKETTPGERRVALVPELVPKLAASGLTVLVETGAGLEAGFPDQGYLEKGAQIQPEVLAQADIVLKVRRPSVDEIGRLGTNSTLIGLLEPYTVDDSLRLIAARRVTAFAMELMPRIARAQSMDALSAMSAIAGYKARAPRGQLPAEVLSFVDDRGRHHTSGQSLCHWRGSGRSGSDRNCEATWRSRRSL